MNTITQQKAWRNKRIKAEYSSRNQEGEVSSAILRDMGLSYNLSVSHLYYILRH